MLAQKLQRYGLDEIQSDRDLNLMVLTSIAILSFVIAIACFGLDTMWSIQISMGDALSDYPYGWGQEVLCLIPFIFLYVMLTYFSCKAIDLGKGNYFYLSVQYVACFMTLIFLVVDLVVVFHLSAFNNYDTRINFIIGHLTDNFAYKYYILLGMSCLSFFMLVFYKRIPKEQGYSSFDWSALKGVNAKMLFLLFLGSWSINTCIITFIDIVYDKVINPFYFIFSDINLISQGLGLMLLSIIAIIVSLLMLIGCMFFRGKSSYFIMVFPLTFLGGTWLAGILYDFMIGNNLHYSPLHMFEIYFNGNFDPLIYKKSYMFGCMIVFFATLFLAIKNMDTYQDNKNNARFAGLFDLMKYDMFKKSSESLFLANWKGKELYANGYEHVLVLAPSGSGKSSTFGIINLVEWQGSSVSNDLSGELYNKTSKYLRHTKKSEVFKFDPLNRANKTHRWNIYHDVCSLPEEIRYGELARIAKLIIPESKGDTSPFSIAARNAVEMISAYLISTSGYCTLSDIAQIACRGDFDEWLAKEIDNTDTDAQFKLRANAYLSVSADETRSGVKFNMDAYLALYLDPMIRVATSYSDFSLSNLRRNKMDVFFTVPQGQINRISPLVTMFWEEMTYQMTLNEPKADEPHAVFCNIDETGNMGRINNLRTGASYLRKYKLRITFYFQYRDQAGDEYSAREMKAFMNTKNKLLFTPSDDDDVEYISKMSGRVKRKIQTKSRQGAWGPVTTSEHFNNENLLEFNDVKYMPDDQLLIQVDGRYIIKATKRFYFKDKKYRYLTRHEIDGDTDKQLPTQKPILPSVLKKIKNKLTEEEKMAKKLEKEERENNKHQREIEKVEKITSVVLSSLDLSATNNDEKEGW
jgi:type IV secretion system protein VirD4